MNRLKIASLVILSSLGLPNISKSSVKGSFICRFKIFSKSVICWTFKRVLSFAVSFCRLVSQTSNDQKSPYKDYQRNFLIDDELYYIFVLQNGTDHLGVLLKKNFKQVISLYKICLLSILYYESKLQNALKCRVLMNSLSKE